MPAPAAVYIIVAVVSVAAASVAFKELVYEPHLAGKFEEYKNKAKFYYWKKRAARQRAPAQPYRSDEPNGDEDMDDAFKRNKEGDVEMEGLLKQRFESNSDAVEVRLRTNARNATTALSSSFPPHISKATSTDIRGNTFQQDQQIRQRNVPVKSVDELLDMEEISRPIIFETLTPSEPTATITTPSNPFVDPKVTSWIAKNDDHAATPNLHSFSPFSQTQSLGVDSPVVLSPMTSPPPRIGALSPPAPLSEHNSSNPWDAISRGASPMSVPDIRSSSSMSMSGWDSGPEHILDQENDESNFNLSLSSPLSHFPPLPSSQEVVWSADEDEYGSEGSFSTNSTSNSSIGSDFAEGIRRELLSSPGGPHVDNINGLTNSLSDPEWEQFSDLERRSDAS
ncbi:hypothetical protein Clacol_001056 [Clathrus columnatus]|uniref:Uncharacterized protein n=1 Tax=Clathrus columnatus TaxID=1419009 RepID=A0AAV5A1H4_9AGAM|nr:hypothetical protein Clacol_001056 [Clathrus columnatus]